MAKKKRLSPQGCQSNSPKWPILVGWGISLIIAGVGWWLTFKQLRRAEVNVTPELELTYELPSLKSSDQKVVVRASGLVGVKDVWLQERAFLVTSNLVFDAPAIPTFRYWVYNGSTSRMFDLQPGCLIKFDRENLQDRVAGWLTHILGGKVVLSWRAQYRREADGRMFTQDWYFTGTSQSPELNPIVIQEAPGGEQLLKRVQQHIASGVSRYIVLPPDGSEPRQVTSLSQPWYRLPNGHWKPWEEYDGAVDFTAYSWLDPYLDITIFKEQANVTIKQTWVEENDRIHTAIVQLRSTQTGHSGTNALFKGTMNMAILKRFPRNFPLRKYKELSGQSDAESVPDCTKEGPSEDLFEE